MISWMWCWVCCIAIHFASFALGAVTLVPRSKLALSILKPDKKTRAHIQHISTTAYSQALVVASKFDAAPVQQAVALQDHQKSWNRWFAKNTRFSYEEFGARKMSNAGQLWTPKITKEGSYYIGMMHRDVFGKDFGLRVFMQEKMLSAVLEGIRNRPDLYEEWFHVAVKTALSYAKSLHESYALHPPPIASLRTYAQLTCKRCMQEMTPRATRTVGLSFADLRRLCSAMSDPVYSHRLLVFLILRVVARNMKGSDDAVGLLRAFLPKSKLFAIKAPFETTNILSSFVQTGEVLDSRSFLLMFDFERKHGAVSIIAKAYAQPGDMLIGVLPSENYPANTPIAILLRDYAENSLAESPAITDSLDLENPMLRIKVPAHAVEGDECYTAFVTDALLKHLAGPFPDFIDRIDAQTLPDPCS